MAQTNFTPISLYYSATATNVPTAGNLVAGELAINTADGKLFYKDSAGVVQTIATKNATAGTYSSITTNQLTIGTTQLGAGDSSMLKNRIINGAMVIDQRNAGASVTPADAEYTLDRFIYNATQSSKVTIQQDAGAVTPPVGFNDYLGVTSTSAYSVGSGDFFTVGQRIEGFNVADLNWGTANAKTVTLSFWVRSSLTGTFGGAITNSAINRSYPFTYTISSSNTWEYKTVTIAGDTTGTWLTTNGIGMRLYISLGVGSTYAGTAGAWSANTYLSATGATSVVGTNGATFYITGVQLEVGSTATSFDYRPYGTELQLCQRYFWRMNGRSSGGNATFAAGQVYNSTDVRAILTNPVPMRADTSITFTGTNFAYANAGSVKALGTPLAADQTTQTALLYSGAGTTSATQGQAAFWVITNTDTFISVSAEL
jgi:hypothetical protein